MAIRMIGLDLDGTTLDAEGCLADRTIDAFRHAREKGVHVVIATGRAVRSLPDELYRIGGLEYAITSNGARIIELATKETIWTNFIDEDAVKFAHDVLKENNAMIEIFYRGRAYISAEEYERVTTGGETRRNRKYVSETRTPVDDIFAMLFDGASEMENISINYQNLEDKLALEEKLSVNPNLTVTSSFPFNTEIGGATTSKASGLMYMMEKLGVKPEELMCCGDSYNDIEMIKLAGVGVAMENAPDDVKKIADYVTAAHYDDGVAKAIEKFVL